MPESLEARLARLEDLMEIHQLFVDYGRHLDAGDFDAYAELFADEGEVLLGPTGRAKGRTAIRDMMRESLGGRVGSTFHIVSSPAVTLDGDRATSQVMWTVVSPAPDGSVQVPMVGRHLDELVRERGRWRFLKRKGALDLPRP